MIESEIDRIFNYYPASQLKAEVKKYIGAKLVLKEIREDVPNKQYIEWNKIVTEVCGYFDMDLLTLTKKIRKREIVYARQMLCTLATENTRLSLKSIGVLIGGKDHTTVIHGRDTIYDLMQTDSAVRNDWNILTGRIKRI